MRKLIVLGVVGLLAQLVDGSLGMAYGVTSTTLLLTAGIAPATASAAVHLAEIGTTLASGAAHWRFGNVDWKVVGRIAVPGAIGAFAGATVLSSIATDAAAPWMSGILLALGVYILLRFTVRPPQDTGDRRPLRARFLAPLGAFAGFVDATGGGGWGPVATPALLASGRMEPRKIIGSVDTSEFLIATSASVGFLIGLGGSAIPFDIVATLLVGGLIAAPIAAWLVRVIPARMLGAAVGGLIVLTNLRTLFKSFGTPDDIRYVAYAAVSVAWAAAVAVALRAVLRSRAAEPAQVS
ncbi:sulfite exporter TauE/SafE family protein [Bailinhaonella thermotolerans]|uniref:Probable membrane transporter protein n=1 Tax=Bailinhaonella thermotolerans TaxID=1070861 RepID=A0A3A4AIW0_9ACTN|nr:sulfite exporter TauE/SafE family protein [Bailinhaonella thermotolerans]RJL26547.1 sulfite exporter TauE/SafE family protein [Bailinhaonella thermotolerans]